MINGVYADIYKDIKSKLNKTKNIKLWVCYFYISNNITTNEFEVFDIKPAYITLNDYNLKNNIIYVKTDKLNKIDITGLYTQALFFSENKDNCINMYNNLIYNSIDSMAAKMNLLKKQYDIIVEQINYSKMCFIETDYVMEKLTHE